MRKSLAFISFTGLQCILLLGAALHARFSQAAAAKELKDRTMLVREISLTDLCLFTEARYTRHPAMADRFAPFQDHPTSLEHFPSGSLVTPPNMRVHENTP